VLVHVPASSVEAALAAVRDYGSLVIGVRD
jgi:hypothetical protein